MLEISALIGGIKKEPSDQWKESLARFKKKESYQKMNETIEAMVEVPQKKTFSFSYKDFYKIAGVKQHSEFEKFLATAMLDKKEREVFYDRLLEVNPDLSVDTFKPYFELYAAERKTFQQDYTPDEVAGLLARLTRSGVESHQSSHYSGYDMTAGTGSLLIQKWQDDRIQETPWSYAPHRYLYFAEEMADNVIPYLIHNLAIRGMNAIVVHGDAIERKAKNVYFIQNSADDYMGYSDVNVMPRTKDTEKTFDIREWEGEPTTHVESSHVYWQFALPMKRKSLGANTHPKIEPRTSREDLLVLSDVATIERARKKKVYPKGTIIIQVSASSGQTGWLVSDGEVESKYAVAMVHSSLDSYFIFQQIKMNMPKHLARIQEGMNVPVESLGELPVAITLATRQEIQEQMALELF